MSLKTEFYIKKLAKGLCATCYSSRGGNTRYCDKCLEAIRRSSQKLRHSDTESALHHYGGICVFCDESYTPFLTFDHKNDDGAAIRRQVMGKNGGFNICSWLRLNNYPDNIQILCFNCNCGKSKLGERPLLELLKAHSRLSQSGQSRLNEIAMGTL